MKRLYVPRTILLSVLFLTMLHLPAAAVGAQSTPRLLAVIAVDTPSDSLSIHGGGFTPGGLLYIELRDTRDGRVHHHLWTVASITSHGPNGSADPALEAVNRGIIEVIVPLAFTTVYGQNGSQDPATGFVSDATAFNMARAADEGVSPTRQLACDGFLTARAYDRDTAIWTEEIAVTAACS